MIEIIQEWDEQAQQFFLFMTLVVIGLVAMYAMRNFRIIVCGYPPLRLERIDCNHDDNLTGVCIKSGSNCTTSDQCNNAIECRSKE